MFLLFLGAGGCSVETQTSSELEPFGMGTYSVGSTNMEIAPEYADIGDEAMHEYLLGRAEEPDHSRYIADILKYPESAWITDVQVPSEPSLYGPASGLSMPVVSFVMYPSTKNGQQNKYAFPYYQSEYGVFADMLGADDVPRFADPDERYPLVILAHGSLSHGIYDVSHAQDLASHGYIVAVINYGDERTAIPDTLNHHVKFLRPLITKAVLDSLIDSDAFGTHIDIENIGITGHSFGGFTALATAGGPVLGNAMSVRDERIKAGVIAAPWVGGHYDGSDFFAFGFNNSALAQVDAPMLCLFGTNDEDALASFILPAIGQLSGPTYVVELVDQPHIFEEASWVDRNNWELLFFSAYLKNKPASLATLKTLRSMRGGNEDVQLFDYQKSNSE